MFNNAGHPVSFSPSTVHATDMTFLSNSTLKVTQLHTSSPNRREIGSFCADTSQRLDLCATSDCIFASLIPLFMMDINIKNNPEKKRRDE
jgi:hypothetical protein